MIYASEPSSSPVQHMAIWTILSLSSCLASQHASASQVNWMLISASLTWTCSPSHVCTSTYLALPHSHLVVPRSTVLSLFPNLLLKCLTTRTWWLPAIHVVVVIWLALPSSVVACQQRKLKSKCLTSSPRTPPTSLSGSHTTSWPLCAISHQEVSKWLPLSSVTLPLSVSSSNVLVNNSLPCSDVRHSYTGIQVKVWTKLNSLSVSPTWTT